jgi:hypothetical protein
LAERTLSLYVASGERAGNQQSESRESGFFPFLSKLSFIATTIFAVVTLPFQQH